MLLQAAYCDICHCALLIPEFGFTGNLKESIENFKKEHKHEQVSREPNSVASSGFSHQ